jgi:hypothetical protein
VSERPSADPVRRRAGRCAKHNDFAWLFNDGSIGCYYTAIVEMGHGECVWEPMPEEWLTAALTDGTERDG